MYSERTVHPRTVQGYYSSHSTTESQQFEEVRGARSASDVTTVSPGGIPTHVFYKKLVNLPPL